MGLIRNTTEGQALPSHISSNAHLLPEWTVPAARRGIHLLPFPVVASHAFVHRTNIRFMRIHTVLVRTSFFVDHGLLLATSRMPWPQTGKRHCTTPHVSRESISSRRERNLLTQALAVFLSTNRKHFSGSMPRGTTVSRRLPPRAPGQRGGWELS